MSSIKRTTCPKGTRKNTKTGICEKHTVKESTRCPRGTRKNKKTGKCDSVLDNTCAICLDRITSSNVKTRCKHNFHKKCLVAWCKSSPECKCPICRGDIKSTCKKIIPFDSGEVFRYIPTYGRMNDVQIEQAEKIMKHKDFDVNVTRTGPSLTVDGITYRGITVSLLESLVRRNNSNSQLIDYLLKQPEIEVKDELVSELIGSKSYDMLQLFKKNKKIPKHLKNLI